MKKIIFSIIGVVAFAVFLSFNISAGLKGIEMDVTLSSIEALAQGESGSGSGCNAAYGYCDWSGMVRKCGRNLSSEPCSYWGGSDKCNDC